MRHIYAGYSIDEVGVPGLESFPTATTSDMFNGKRTVISYIEMEDIEMQMFIEESVWRADVKLFSSIDDLKIFVSEMDEWDNLVYSLTEEEWVVTISHEEKKITQTVTIIIPSRAAMKSPSTGQEWPLFTEMENVINLSSSVVREVKEDMKLHISNIPRNHPLAASLFTPELAEKIKSVGGEIIYID